MKIDLNAFPYDYGNKESTPNAAESGRSFTLRNDSKFIVKRWSIDKVVFKNREEKRCDYLIEVTTAIRPTYFWIELKGKDIVKACRQIANTIELVIVSNSATHEARIITSGTNKIDIRTKEFVGLDNLMRRSGGRLKTYTNEKIETI